MCKFVIRSHYSLRTIAISSNEVFLSIPDLFCQMTSIMAHNDRQDEIVKLHSSSISVFQKQWVDDCSNYLLCNRSYIFLPYINAIQVKDKQPWWCMLNNAYAFCSVRLFYETCYLFVKTVHKGRLKLGGGGLGLGWMFENSFFWHNRCHEWKHHR